MAGSSFLLLVTVVMVVSVRLHESQLAYDYYKFSCPLAETTVKKEMVKIFLTDVSAPPAFLRLFFHDCQVQGCDASILLNSRALTCKSEMETSQNFGIRKLEAINHIKSILEITCPGQVSCADMIALAAKESVLITGGPDIKIPLGRKDSVTCSSPQQADAKLPAAGIAVDELLRIFTSHGMNLEESVAILGSRTLGAGHCINIVNRLYKQITEVCWGELFFAGARTLGAGHCINIVNRLYKQKAGDPTEVPLTNLTAFPNDLTPLTFDNQYYKGILMGTGLFGIDSSISRNPCTLPIVRQFATDQSYFFQVFSSAFVKLSTTKVLTHNKGEVRRQWNHIYEGKILYH